MGNEYYLNSISHHGILGQKWGRLNGPPYPLSRSDLSASEKKADDKNRSIKETSSRKQKSRLSMKQKNALVGAGIIVAEVLAIYGGYKLYKALDGAIDKQTEIYVNAIINGASDVNVADIPDIIADIPGFKFTIWWILFKVMGRIL